MTDIPINVIEPARESVSSDGKKRQLRKSIWHITISTNKKFTGTESYLKEAEDQLLEAIEDMFEDRANLEHLLPLRPKAVEEGNRHNSDYFKEIDVEIGEPELGPDSRILHVHVLLIVKHYTLVSLNTKFIQKAVGERLGMGVYVNMHLLPSNVANVQEYINKNSRKI